MITTSLNTFWLHGLSFIHRLWSPCDIASCLSSYFALLFYRLQYFFLTGLLFWYSLVGRLNLVDDVVRWNKVTTPGMNGGNNCIFHQALMLDSTILDDTIVPTSHFTLSKISARACPVGAYSDNYWGRKHTVLLELVSVISVLYLWSVLFFTLSNLL